MPCPPDTPEFLDAQRYSALLLEAAMDPRPALPRLWDWCRPQIYDMKPVKRGPPRLSEGDWAPPTPCLLAFFAESPGSSAVSSCKYCAHYRDLWEKYCKYGRYCVPRGMGFFIKIRRRARKRYSQRVLKHSQ